MIGKGVGGSLGRWSTYPNDRPLILGQQADGVLILRSAALGANTALTVGGRAILVGTPVTSAVAASSLILSNVTASGDILIAANRGGNSESYIFIDSSTGFLTLTAATEVVINCQGGAANDLHFQNTAVEYARFRLVTDGANLWLGGAAAHASTPGRSIISMFTGVAPVGTLASGGSLYVATATNVELNYIDSAGNAQQLSTT